MDQGRENIGGGIIILSIVSVVHSWQLSLAAVALSIFCVCMCVNS